MNTLLQFPRRFANRREFELSRIFFDRTLVKFNNKATGMPYNDLHLLMWHPTAPGDMVFTTLKVFLYSYLHFNHIFTGSELVSTSHE